jgi:ABC-type antimicrobial peptide transport system permease subunit
LQQLFSIIKKRNGHENFTILKREIIHNSLSPLYVQKVAIKFLYVVEDTQMMIEAKNEEKK